MAARDAARTTRIGEHSGHGPARALGDRVGVAVSGGGDSVALLRMLEGPRDALGITLLVVHFDHGLRGVESEADALFVTGLARERGVEFILERADVAAAAASHKWNIEDAARRLRYYFSSASSMEAGQRALRSHTRRTTRPKRSRALVAGGTGPAGLAGIYPIAEAVVRPLLGHRRDDLRKYLRELGQTWREDATDPRPAPLACADSRAAPALARAGFSPARREAPREAGPAFARGGTILDRACGGPFSCAGPHRGRTFAIRIRDLFAPLDLSVRALREKGARENQWFPLRALTERLIRRLYQDLREGRRGLTAERVVAGDSPGFGIHKRTVHRTAGRHPRRAELR